MIIRQTDNKNHARQSLLILLTMYVSTIQHVQSFQQARDLLRNMSLDQHPKIRNYASVGKTHAFRMKGLSKMKLINRAIINK